MPVTELAILTLHGGYDETDLVKTLKQCQTLQDEWTRENQPGNNDGKTSISSMYIEDSSPSSMLITAPWESPEAHFEWIQTSPNETCNASLSVFLQPGDDSVLLFHMDPAGRNRQMRGPLVPKGHVNVCRISVEAGQKGALEGLYQALEDEVGEQVPAERVWAGWRIEKAGTEDLVVFWSDGVPEAKVQKLMEMSDKVDRRRFRHIV